MSNDIAIGNSSLLSGGAPKPSKPLYLIYLTETTVNKIKIIEKFISLDKPTLLQNFIEVKGMFCNLPEDEIIKNYKDILQSASKDLILEVMIPCHKISYMRSLVFKQK